MKLTDDHIARLLMDYPSSHPLAALATEVMEYRAQPAAQPPPGPSITLRLVMRVLGNAMTVAPHEPKCRSLDLTDADCTCWRIRARDALSKGRDALATAPAGDRQPNRQETAAGQSDGDPAKQDALREAAERLVTGRGLRTLKAFPAHQLQALVAPASTWPPGNPPTLLMVVVEILNDVRSLGAALAAPQPLPSAPPVGATHRCRRERCSAYWNIRGGAQLCIIARQRCQPQIGCDLEPLAATEPLPSAKPQEEHGKPSGQARVAQLEAALAWVFGEKPDAQGRWFDHKDFIPPLSRGSRVPMFWWRKPLREMVSKVNTVDGPYSMGLARIYGLGVNTPLPAEGPPAPAAPHEGEK